MHTVQDFNTRVLVCPPSPSATIATDDVAPGTVVVFGRTRECGQIIGDWYSGVTVKRCNDIVRALASNTVVKDLAIGEM